MTESGGDLLNEAPVINAKAEGIENEPAFRKAFERRRCLVPVDNFYEWKAANPLAGRRTPVLLILNRGSFFAGRFDPPLFYRLSLLSGETSRSSPMRPRTELIPPLVPLPATSTGPQYQLLAGLISIEVMHKRVSLWIADSAIETLVNVHKTDLIIAAGLRLKLRAFETAAARLAEAGIALADRRSDPVIEEVPTGCDCLGRPA